MELLLNCSIVQLLNYLTVRQLLTTNVAEENYLYSKTIYDHIN
jgi:hypothetical protein